MAISFTHPVWFEDTFNIVIWNLLQDAHEFLIFLINHINEIIVGEQGQSHAGNNSSKSRSSVEQEAEPGPTWINEIFQVCLGLLGNKSPPLCWWNIYICCCRASSPVRRDVWTARPWQARMKSSVISALMWIRLENVISREIDSPVELFRTRVLLIVWETSPPQKLWAWKTSSSVIRVVHIR